MIVEKPVMLENQRPVDFDPGFYTTTHKEQAIEFAHHKSDHFGGKPILNIYELDYNEIKNGNLTVLTFPSANEEWLDFVADHREQRYAGVCYDVTIGPVANDSVFKTIQKYIRHGFKEKSEAIEALKVNNLYDQIVLTTGKSIAMLKFLRAWRCDMDKDEFTGLLGYTLVPEVVNLICKEDDMSEGDAVNKFLHSKTYSVLEEIDKKAWHLTPMQIYSIWESEQKTGNPVWTQEGLSA
ncbi:MAG: DUF3990 domain-containing protein [Clostridia bacterium]|nr:DUF3990 domain-containing protein [Clostridia bacterium]